MSAEQWALDNAAGRQLAAGLIEQAGDNLLLLAAGLRQAPRGDNGRAVGWSFEIAERLLSLKNSALGVTL